MEVANYEMVIKDALIRSGHLELLAARTLHTHDRACQQLDYYGARIELQI